MPKKKEKNVVGKATFRDAPVSTVEWLTALTQKGKAVTGVLEPKYAPETLLQLYELSSSLSQHIEAIVTNVDAFGHKYTAGIDLTRPGAEADIRDEMIVERLVLSEERREPFVEPDSEAVRAKLEELRRVARIEINRLRTFFAVCCPDYSFVELRSRTRRDLLTTGNAYWEILRDNRIMPARLVLAPSVTMRLLPLDPIPVETKERIPTTRISTTEVVQRRFFRKFAEIDPIQGKIKAYFKEFGDPRTVSRATGKIYASPAALEADPDKPPLDAPANEILHFAIPTPGSTYGVPQWIGNLPAVLGSRELDEVNLSYFQSKTVPPLALLVAGGRLAKGVVPRIEEFIESNIKGRKNFHKILVLEAEGQKSTGGTSGIVPSMKFVPLREAQQQDALFQNYDEGNWEKIGSSFRLPRILVGRDRAINRATAFAALRLAEDQVFTPLRNQFDEVINRKLLPELHISFWKFESNSPTTKDPEVLAEIVATLSDAGVLTPAEGRALATDVFNRELPVLTDPWTQQPFKLTLQEARKGSPSRNPEEEGERVAGRIRALTSQIASEGRAEHRQEPNGHAQGRREAGDDKRLAGIGTGGEEIPEK